VNTHTPRKRKRKTPPLAFCILLGTNLKTPPLLGTLYSGLFVCFFFPKKSTDAKAWGPARRLVAVVTPLNNFLGPEGDTVTMDEQLLNTEYCLAARCPRARRALYRFLGGMADILLAVF